MSEMEIRNFALVEIEKKLLQLGRSLHDFESMPFPSEQYLQPA